LLEGDKPVPLGSRALEILIALLERHGELVSKQDLMARDLLSRRANGHRDEPEPGDGGANPTSLKATTRRPLTVTEVAFPLLVNDHERLSPDMATQGSSV
jgi:hypothetical protein